LVTRDFVVQGVRENLWKLLNDPNELGKCVPGCEEVSISGPDESRWKVKMSIGVISRRIIAKIKVTQRDEPSKLKLQIQSVEGDLSGEWTVELLPKPDSTTEVKFSASMKATGAFQWILNQIIKSEMDKMIRQFADCISKRMLSS
jgi:uncharacterized protein